LDWANTEFPALVGFVGKMLFFAAGVFVTLWISPQVSEDLENERRRTAYYIKSLDVLNGDTKELLARLTTYNYEKISKNKEKEVDELRIELREMITKLHWRAIEFSLIFKGDKFEEMISNYQLSLNLIGKYLEAENKFDKAEMDQLVTDFAASTSDLVRFLAAKAERL